MKLSLCKIALGVVFSVGKLLFFSVGKCMAFFACFSVWRSWGKTGKKKRCTALGKTSAWSVGKNHWSVGERWAGWDENNSAKRSNFKKDNKKAFRLLTSPDGSGTPDSRILYLSVLSSGYSGQRENGNQKCPSHPLQNKYIFRNDSFGKLFLLQLDLLYT